MASPIKTKAAPAVVCLPPERLADVLRRKDTEYLGPCIVQAHDGWTRAGAAWWTSRGWVVWGPGLARWQTTQGLAELASQTTATPTYHATGWAVAPAPNLVFAIEPVSLKHLAPVADHVAAAEAWMAAGMEAHR